MNLRTPTDVDRAIAAARHLHDLRAGQTGTAPARRPSNPDRPADKAPVEFEATDDDRTISTRMTAFRALMTGEDFAAADAAGLAILAMPVGSLSDLAAKHEVMMHAYIDELPDEYRQLFRQFGAEIKAVRPATSALPGMAGRVRSTIRLAKLALDEGESRGDEWNLLDDALDIALTEAEALEDLAFAVDEGKA
ncbi:hypothetical protein EV667_1328 [Ancylobacter aquaticus]|uniref:Uncharacterized protein n=1 Tax=Ancylobacter aquaticus TaxID=100 RepID=A0A4R1IHW9_ANCAQ|nr:hypothetical protein [Ancylobacter aquaticus]TCK31222.1 hypothetical protein EV667_1328 [Ancylobacter aquaticus]